eukprot:1756464-Pyramimonas_sp.AAC.1
MIDEVRNHQSQRVSDLVPIEWQENASPRLEHDPSMENVWDYLESRCCKFDFDALSWTEQMRIESARLMAKERPRPSHRHSQRA